MESLAGAPDARDDYRVTKFYALLASAYVDWDVRGNDMSALEADNVSLPLRGKE